MSYLGGWLSDIAQSLRGGEQRFSVSIDIPAPLDVVWRVASARTITFPGNPPISMRELPSPRPGEIVVVEVTMAALRYRLAFRLLDVREGFGEFVEVVPELSDEQALRLGIRRMGYGLEEIAAGTRMTSVQEGDGMNALLRLAALRSLRVVSARTAAACRLQMADADQQRRE